MMDTRFYLGVDTGSSPDRTLAQLFHSDENGRSYLVAQSYVKHDPESIASAIRSYDRRARIARRNMLLGIAAWLLLTLYALLFIREALQ